MADQHDSEIHPITMQAIGGVQEHSMPLLRRQRAYERELVAGDPLGWGLGPEELVETATNDVNLAFVDADRCRDELAAPNLAHGHRKPGPLCLQPQSNSCGRFERLCAVRGKAVARSTERGAIHRYGGRVGSKVGVQVID